MSCLSVAGCCTITEIDVNGPPRKLIFILDIWKDRDFTASKNKNKNTINNLAKKYIERTYAAWFITEICLNIYKIIN